MLLHETRQALHVLNRRLRQDAMAEIENMPRASGSTAKNIFRTRLYFFPVSEEKHWIEIALHRALVIEASPAFIEWNAPVESNNVGSRFAHRWQKRGAIGAKVNNGHSRLLQLLHHAGDVREDGAAIVFHAETSHPAVENLDDVGSRAHLIGGVGRRDGDELAHECIPVGGTVVHHFLGVDVIARTSAFNHVTGKSE